ncbi:head-tail joining protein [Bartonella sp. A05]|uniref:head-tail joining protein n=1 Tax=Bartonella sp. A05 TaxID=2967261 RepID=UPI0022A9CD20|nr:hypothetical protein [Bartonella sp. A05]MCZ2204002.1 hypothetical protein [Bartonella sp. A05]
MKWQGLLSQVTEEVRDIFGQPVIYTRKDTNQSFYIKAIYTIKHSESEAGGRVATTIARKELDLCIKDIGGLPPKPEDIVVVQFPDISVKNGGLLSQERFSVKDVQASESGMYKLILRDAPLSNMP